MGEGFGREVEAGYDSCVSVYFSGKSRTDMIFIVSAGEVCREKESFSLFCRSYLIVPD